MSKADQETALRMERLGHEVLAAAIAYRKLRGHGVGDAKVTNQEYCNGSTATVSFGEASYSVYGPSVEAALLGLLARMKEKHVRARAERLQSRLGKATIWDAIAEALDTVERGAKS
jgi:hypothetical protein